MRPKSTVLATSLAAEGGATGHYRFVYLLAAQLALIVLYPFLAGDQPRPGLSAALALAVFAAALWVVAAERRVRVVSVALAAPAIVGCLLTVVVPGFRWLLPGLGFGMLFLAYVTGVIFRGVVASGEVTRETLYGAITAYLSLGVTWAWAYALVEHVLPGSFRSLLVPDGRVAGPEFTFFSFITLTSVGYGDIVPVGGHARSLAILEAVAGVMYQAIFVARLVGLYQGSKPASR